MRKNLLLGASGWWEAENKTQEEEKIERVTEMGCDNVSFGLVRLLGWWVNMRAARKKKGGRGGSERGARAGGASPSGWWRRFEAPESQSGKSVQDGWSASRFYRSSFLYVTHCAYALISLKAQKPLGHGERTSWIDPKYHFFSAQTQLGMSQFPIKISFFLTSRTQLKIVSRSH